MVYDFKAGDMLVEGKAALVTGGGTGIGAAIAVALARAGADVAVTYNTHRPDQTGTEVEAAGRAFQAFRSDFSNLDPADAGNIVDNVRERFGRFDIIVNNAGIIRRNRADTLDASDWRDVLSVNLDAAFYMAQAAGRRFVAQGGGRVINVASVLSFQGGLNVAAYSTAKHGLAGLTQSLCNDWAPFGVTVNAVAPGYTATDNTKALRDDSVRMKELVSRVPAGRFADPHEIAGAAVFLASEAARYINGHLLVVDGGWLAR